jgi:phasin family protein
MHTGVNEFLEEQAKGLAELVKNIRKARVKAARQAALDSAARIKSLNVRVRNLARSGVRLSSISQTAAENLIELQSEIVTTALSDAAQQLQRAAVTHSVSDLARGQADVLRAARERIVDDIARVVVILKDAAGDARQVTKPAKVTKGAKARKRAKAPAAPVRTKPVRRKAKAKAATKAKVPAKRKAGKSRRRG